LPNENALVTFMVRGTITLSKNKHLPRELHRVSDTFCILPWKSLSFSPNGCARVCCQFTGFLAAEDGSRLSIHKHSLEEIWNSQDMRSIREDLLAGKQVTACEQCYHHEAAGEISLRQLANADWQRGLPDEDLTALEPLRAWSAAHDHRVPPPSQLELILGNLCNLKCRMCLASYSSRIQSDPVHRKWSGSDLPVVSDGLHWWQQEALIGELLRHPERLVELTLIGGEPLIIKECGHILQRLIDAGVAPRIDLSFTTNGTTTSSPWLKLTQQFRRLNLFFSIDGAGATYEYIRYPARWATLGKNIEFFRGLPNATLGAHVTVQAYNVLDIVDLFRHLDRIGLRFSSLALVRPERLAARVLPPPARRLAAQRLRAYAGQDCRPEHRDLVLGLAGGLESLGDGWDPDLFQEFIRFTNDLDRSRGQSLRQALPELWDALAAAGVGWSDATEHAAPPGQSSETAKLQGTWKVLRAETGGTQLPRLEGTVLAFQGDQVTVQRPGLGANILSYKVEDTGGQKSLALFFPHMLIRVVYRWESDQLMKWSFNGVTGPRLPAAEGPRESGPTLLSLARQKA
jgi:MoaA/NifB/PqqE/SkfB family radical SAM enzyme